MVTVRVPGAGQPNAIFVVAPAWTEGEPPLAAQADDESTRVSSAVRFMAAPPVVAGSIPFAGQRRKNVTRAIQVGAGNRSRAAQRAGSLRPDPGRRRSRRIGPISWPP